MRAALAAVAAVKVLSRGRKARRICGERPLGVDVLAAEVAGQLTCPGGSGLVCIAAALALVAGDAVPTG